MKNILAITVKVFIVSIVLLLIAENYLYFRNYPETPKTPGGEGKVIYGLEGWINHPDSVHISPEDPRVIETTDELGRRVTPYVANPAYNALILGCSYSFGVAVADRQTFAWKIGEHFPGIQFDNYAAPGYGTHQCRIMLRRILEEQPLKYSKVFYFFIEDHLRRNISINLMDCDHIVNPWARMAQNIPEYHASGEIVWPGASNLRTLHFLRSLYIKHFMVQSFAEIEQVQLFNGIISEMLNEAKAHNAEFYVCFLEFGDRNYINEKLYGQGLKVLDLSFKDLNKPQYHLQGTGHPTSEVHQYWAETFCEKMQGIL
ncbi:MAG: hypothetical protein K6G50_03365 [bacterium]|nr:hypothetical protein [bacterium]